MPTKRTEGGYKGQEAGETRKPHKWPAANAKPTFLLTFVLAGIFRQKEHRSSCGGIQRRDTKKVHRALSRAPVHHLPEM